MEQSRRLGLEAQASFKRAVVDEFARVLVTPAAQIPGAPSDLQTVGDVWNALKAVDPTLPEPPTEADLRAVSEEFITRRTIRGRAFDMNNPQQRRLYEALDSKVPSLAQYNAMGQVVNESVTESTGNTGFLQGLKWGNLLDTLIQGFSDWASKGFRGSLFSCIRRAGFEITRNEACDRARDGMNDLVRRGVIPPEMAARVVPGLRDGMTEDARRRGLDVGAPAGAAQVSLAQLASAHQSNNLAAAMSGAGGPGAAPVSVSADAVRGRPPAEALPMVFTDIANTTLRSPTLAALSGSPQFGPSINAAREHFTRTATRLATAPGANLSNTEAFADATLRETIIQMAGDDTFSAVLDRGRLSQVAASDNWQQVLDKLARDRTQAEQLKTVLLTPLRNNIVASEEAVQTAAGAPVVSRTPAERAAMAERASQAAAQSAEQQQAAVLTAVRQRIQRSRSAVTADGVESLINAKIDKATSGLGNNPFTRWYARNFDTAMPLPVSIRQASEFTATRTPAIFEEEMIRVVRENPQVSDNRELRELVIGRVAGRFRNEFRAEFPHWEAPRVCQLMDGVSASLRTSMNEEAMTELRTGIRTYHAAGAALAVAAGAPPQTPAVTATTLATVPAAPVMNPDEVARRAVDFATANGTPTAPGGAAPLPVNQGHGLSHTVQRTQVAGVGTPPGIGGP